MEEIELFQQMMMEKSSPTGKKKKGGGEGEEHLPKLTSHTKNNSR